MNMTTQQTDLEGKTLPLLIGIPILLIIDSTSPYKSQNTDEQDSYIVILRTVLPKQQVASMIAVSRNGLIVGELQLTEGNL
jgi:hypothetical protein